MLSDDFREDPVGVDFDPEDVLARMRAGVEESVLVKRPDIGPRGMDTIPM